jgi:sodium/hydrogen antiporter
MEELPWNSSADELSSRHNPPDLRKNHESGEFLMYQMLAVLCAFAFLYSLVGARLERTPVAGAIVFTGFGVLAGPLGAGLLSTANPQGLRFLAELTLALVLFIDAANADLGVLRRNLGIPERLLLVGLPLTILLGFGAGALLFPALGWVGWALLGTMLAPTDAALGKAVVTNQAVPAPIRESLNVESGLNDGICVPLLLILLAIASTPGGAHGIGAVIQHHFFLKEIGIGILVGALIALVGQRAIRFAGLRGWISATWRQLPVVALAFTIFGTAQTLGGSGFIACFVGGLLAGALSTGRKHEVLQPAEGTGDAFSLLTWVVFGAAVVGPALDRLTWQILTYALLSLTLVRMLPVYLAMIGSATRPSGRLFLGWFGPRGLASVVFAVMVLEAGVANSDTLTATVAWTVILSIVAHGITAVPLAAAFSRRST